MLNNLYIYIFSFLRKQRSFISTAGTKVSLILKSPISIIEMSSALRPGLCGSTGFLQLQHHVRERLKQGSAASLEEYTVHLWETEGQARTMIYNPDDTMSTLLTSGCHCGFHSWEIHLFHQLSGCQRRFFYLASTVCIECNLLSTQGAEKNKLYVDLDLKVTQIKVVSTVGW